MNNLSRAVKLIGFPVLVFAGGLLVMNWLGRSAAGANEKPLNERWGYTAQDAVKYWQGLDEDELLPVEVRLLKVDLLFPLFYGGALLTSILTAWRTLGQPPFWNLAVIPVWLAVLADWTENSSLLYLLQSHMKDTTASPNSSLVQIASAATITKFIFLAVSGVALLVLVGKSFRDGKRV